MSSDDSHEYRELLVRQLEKYRLKKDISQRELSLSLGQGASYIAKLTNPKSNSYPRMINFFYLCDFFGIHPKEFFDEEKEHPEQIEAMINDLYKLTDTQRAHIHAIIQDFIAQNS